MRRDTGKGLRQLWLQNQSLTVISSQICHLKNIRSLDLSRNRIRELPEELCCLARLERLILSGNLLKALPEGFHKLANLQEIYARENRFDQFPDELLKVKRLIVIDLSGNKIKHVPPAIVELRSLAELALDNNCLTPEGLANVKWSEMGSKLRRLGLGGNPQVEEIPQELFQCSSLCTLRVPQLSRYREYCNYVNANVFKQGFEDELKFRPSHGDMERRMYAKLHATSSGKSGPAVANSEAEPRQE